MTDIAKEMRDLANEAIVTGPEGRALLRAGADEVERLRSALRPFAESPYATVAGDWGDHEICKGIKVSDLRKAYALLSAIPPSHSETP
jgi:hypothetical protein